MKTFTAILFISKHGYVFSFNLTFKFNDYAFLLYQNNMHASRRSHLVDVVTKLRHKPVMHLRKVQNSYSLNPVQYGGEALRHPTSFYAASKWFAAGK